MSKRRVSGAKSKASRSRSSNHLDKFHRFIGVSLGGGKNEKTSLVLIEYFPAHDRLFVREVHERIRTHEELSGDESLIELISGAKLNLRSVTFDVAVDLPACQKCKKKCPGYETCREPHIKWFWENYRDRRKKKKTSRLFTPYTERAAEYFLAESLETKFHPESALGANMAPLTARALFLKRRIKCPVYEIHPPAVLWRIGKNCGVPEDVLKTQKRSLDRDEHRKIVLEAILDRKNTFIYQQDVQRLVDNANSFDAFLCAFTGFLKFLKQCEKRPTNYPKLESWIEIPLQKINWFSKI